MPAGRNSPGLINMNKNKKLKRSPINTSEALFGFLSWLTTRKNKITLSSNNTPNPALTLLKSFIDANGLPAVRNNYTSHYMIPQGLDALTDDPPVNSCVRSWSPQEVQQAINDLLETQSDKNQNQIIGKVLQRLKVQRTNRYDKAQRDNLQSRRDEGEAYDTMNDFNNIVNGNFTVL